MLRTKLKLFGVVLALLSLLGADFSGSVSTAAAGIVTQSGSRSFHVSYRTTFSATENPLSEGGVWKQNNVYFTKFRQTGGRAYGQYPLPFTGTEYQDSYAILQGMGFTPAQYVATHIWKDGGSAGYNEAEILLRFSDTANSTQGYECYVHWNGNYVTVTKWTGGALSAPADVSYFVEISRVTGITPPNDGSLYEAWITAGNKISVRLDGVLLFDQLDVTAGGTIPLISTGDPGIGADGTDVGTASSYGFKDFYATGL